MGGALPHPRRCDRELFADSRSYWRVEICACGRARMRLEPSRRSNTVPSRGEDRRFSVRLSLGRRAETCPSRQRGELMSAHAAELVTLGGHMQERMANVTWDRVYTDLDGKGFAVIEGALDPSQC